MPFGRPSFTCHGLAPPTTSTLSTADWQLSNFKSQLSSLTSHSPPNTSSPTPLLPLLDLAFVSSHVQRLIQYFDLRLSDQQLRHAEQHVLSEIRPLLGRPLEEVYSQACAIWTTALVKKGIGGGTEGYSGVQGHDDTRIAGLLESPAHSHIHPAIMATPTLGQFLNQVNGLIAARNESKLADWLVLEPPFGPIYHQMIQELRQVFPKHKESALEDRCAQSLKAAQEGDQGSNWTSFTRFMVQYLGYLRDVSSDASAYLETYNLLRDLQGRANSALAHPSLGYLMLQTVVTNARLVCRLAIGLDRQPELLAGSTMEGAGEEGGYRETLPEKAANTIRVAFTTALNDRSGSPGGLDEHGFPEGKKRGVYTLANLCLKILFQCRKTRNATQIFEQISGNAPPLAAYPKSQRVTYLYYLGRFLFQHNHFYRAQLALQTAYDESPAHAQCTKQRRLILVYLIVSNIILGRFPSPALLSRPEAEGLTARFQPLCAAIRAGNLAAFHHLLSPQSPHASWYLHYRILFQLQNRCELLVSRSLVRKTFLLTGIAPEAGTNKAASLHLASLTTAFTHLSPPDDAALSEADADFDGAPILPEGDLLAPDDTALEAVLSSLIDQGFLRAYIAHKQRKLAILGAKSFGGNAVVAGFPNVWGVVCRKDRDDGRVPGWKRGEGGGGWGVFG
ncbi:hypothetical protein Q7P37_006261 [Cladosporium fusiforme]